MNHQHHHLVTTGAPPKRRVAAMAMSMPMDQRERVEIVYYLSRNGQLEHPHFMELTHLPNHHLTLKDFTEKLASLRGRGMPELFSWSCKRSYKNGYVWNDLSEDDVIYPADGAEYVLKGSEIIPGCAAVDRFQQLTLSSRRAKPMIPLRQLEDGLSDIPSNTSLRSRGVNTEEIIKPTRGLQTVITVDDGSPALSSSSSDPTAAETAAGMGRNSVFLQLIACGSAPAKAGRKSGGMHSGVVSFAAVADAGSGEDKEYFSGSIMEVVRKPELDQQPRLKRSSSFDEQRGSKAGLGGGERMMEVGEEGGGEGVKGKCIPGRKRSSFKLLSEK